VRDPWGWLSLFARCGDCVCGRRPTCRRTGGVAAVGSHGERQRRPERLSHEKEVLLLFFLVVGDVSVFQWQIYVPTLLYYSIFIYNNRSNIYMVRSIERTWSDADLFDTLILYLLVWRYIVYYGVLRPVYYWY
jgi:hypothetical protein